LYWVQLCSKNRKAFIFSGSLSKSLISVLLLKEPHERAKAQESALEQSADDSARAARLAESLKLFGEESGEAA
jgi:hypothetical protein